MGLSPIALFCVLLVTSITGQYIIACTNNVTSTTNVPTASSFVPAQASPAQRSQFNALQNFIQAQLANNALQALNPFNPFSFLGPIFNLANPLNPLNPFNPVGLTSPISPFGFASPFNPLSPASPANFFNPLNPLNPVNPVSPLNVANPFNPFTPFGQANNFALLTGAFNGALAAVRPVLTLPGVGGEVGASEPIVFGTLLRDLVSLNLPGVVARFNLTGPVDMSTIVVTCSIPSACGTPNITKNSDGSVSVVVPIRNSFPDPPIVVPLTITLTLKADQTMQLDDGRVGTPTDRVSIVHDLYLNSISIPNTRATGQSLVRFCEEAQDLLDGQCGNRCHNNKRKCAKDPGCRWFARGEACIKKNSNSNP